MGVMAGDPGGSKPGGGLLPAAHLIYPGRRPGPAGVGTARAAGDAAPGIGAPPPARPAASPTC